MANKNFFYIDAAQHPDVKERVGAGILGAFLFALGGGILYILFAQVGFISVLSGLAGVFLAIKGYQIFGKKLSKRGLVIAVVVTVLVLILAWYINCAITVYREFKDEFNFFECLLLVPKIFKDYPEFTKSSVLNLVVSLVFAGVGGAILVSLVSARMKQNAQYDASQAINYVSAQAENAVNTVQETVDQAAGVVNNVYDAANDAVNAADDAIKAVDDAAEAVEAADAADAE
jgi:hypothetical protein